ncbi:MAG: TIGR04211 family SH3 domain-containing protein [Deltaproteobacteria bacterium]|nr:TIGR04211 family SH3 domain-containing protein [Deltaproteobacteria bacterium]MBW2067469.1 TIGR04211 family SH3 domain-containing protein [Deltaproteobacteria bacterium]
MNNRSMYIVAAVLVVIFCRPVWGKIMYVTDFIEITFRTGPSIENRIIGLLPTGTRLDVKDNQNDWSLVVPLDGSFKGREGWVLTKYLTGSKPKALILDNVIKENETLHEKLNDATTELVTLRGKLEELKKELNEKEKNLEKLQNDYSTLRMESSDFLNLKSRYNKLLQQFKALEARNKKLQEENTKLRRTQNLRWFISGALVLLTGWFIGLAMGKRRRRSSYYY